MKQLTLPKLKKKVWRFFSEYIRRKNAHGDYNTCVTCLKIYSWKMLHAGHFIPGRGNAVLFHEELVHPQCYSCNIHKHGNWIPYERFMISRYGRKKTNELKKLYYQTKSFRRDELEEILEHYRVKLGRLIEGGEDA